MLEIREKIKEWVESDKDVEWALSSLLQANNNEFYGKITIQFEAGNIILLRKEQTEKPPKSIGGGRAS